MSQRRKTPYTSISVTPEAAEAMRRLAVSLSSAVGFRISISGAALAAERLTAGVDLAAQHEVIKDAIAQPTINLT
jgi:hypothetical protein